MMTPAIGFATSELSNNLAMMGTLHQSGLLGFALHWTLQSLTLMGGDSPAAKPAIGCAAIEHAAFQCSAVATTGSECAVVQHSSACAVHAADKRTTIRESRAGELLTYESTMIVEEAPSLRRWKGHQAFEQST